MCASFNATPDHKIIRKATPMSRAALALLVSTFLFGLSGHALGDASGGDGTVIALAGPAVDRSDSFASIGRVPPKRERKVDVGTLRLREAALPEAQLSYEERMNLRRKAALARIEALSKASRSRPVAPPPPSARGRVERTASSSIAGELRDGFDANGTYHPEDQQDRLERGFFQLGTSSEETGLKSD